MNTLNVRRFGFALGSGLALLYLGCAFVMLTVPRDAALQFFNSLTHGVDWGPVVRWEMPWSEMIVGLLEIFIVGWLFGTVLASLYNLGAGKDA